MPAPVTPSVSSPVRSALVLAASVQQSAENWVRYARDHRPGLWTRCLAFLGASAARDKVASFRNAEKDFLSHVEKAITPLRLRRCEIRGGKLLTGDDVASRPHIASYHLTSARHTSARQVMAVIGNMIDKDAGDSIRRVLKAVAQSSQADGARFGPDARRAAADPQVQDGLVALAQARLPDYLLARDCNADGTLAVDLKPLYALSGTISARDVEYIAGTNENAPDQQFQALALDLLEGLLPSASLAESLVLHDAAPDVPTAIQGAMRRFAQEAPERLSADDFIRQDLAAFAVRFDR